MSELTLMAERIIDAMGAVDEAHHAGNELCVETNHEKFAAFRKKMAELHDHLSNLKQVLDNEEVYAMDELIDALSKAYTGHGINYRKTPHMKA